MLLVVILSIIVVLVLILIIVSIFVINNNSDSPIDDIPKIENPKPLISSKVSRLSRTTNNQNLKSQNVKNRIDRSKINPRKSTIKQPKFELDSDSESDDELNSVDEIEYSSNDDFIRSPFIEQNDGFYPDHIFPDTQVIDVVSFSESKYYLLDNGQIIASNQNRYLIDNNIKLNKIINFRGFLYGLSQNQLFVLPNEMLNLREWNWKLVNNFQFPKNPNYINSTLDGKYLWIQNNNQGFLIDDNLNQIQDDEIINYSTRVYGTNPEEYIILDRRNQTLINPKTDEIFTNVKDAVINYEHRIILLKNDQPMNRIRIINWKPYYL